MKNEKNEDREKQEKGERGFVGYLIGGLILITFGLFSVLAAKQCVAGFRSELGNYALDNRRNHHSRRHLRSHNRTQTYTYAALEQPTQKGSVQTMLQNGSGVVSSEYAEIVFSCRFNHVADVITRQHTRRNDESAPFATFKFMEHFNAFAGCNFKEVCVIVWGYVGVIV